MKKENLEQAKMIGVAVEAHEDFISQCDYFIRNTTDREIPAFDRWLIAAVRDGVVSAADLKHLITDLRDIATTRLQSLDKRLEAL